MVDMNQTDFGLEPEQGDQPPQLGMVQCQVTGKWLPEEETVEFQGYRVGAEGKEVLLERLRSGADVGDTTRPGVGRRFGCYLLDAILLWIVAAIIEIALAFIAGIQIFQFNHNTQSAASHAVTQATTFAGVAVGISIIVVLYYGLMHGTRGATFGKMAGKLKVVKRDGSDINIRIGILRSLYFVGPRLAVACLFVALVALIDPITAIFINAALAYAVFAYLLADAIVALVDSQQQRAIHDRLAGTRVIHIDG